MTLMPVTRPLVLQLVFLLLLSPFLHLMLLMFAGRIPDGESTWAELTMQQRRAKAANNMRWGFLG